MLGLRHFRTINYVCVFPLYVSAVPYHSVRSHCAHCARCMYVGVVYGVHWRHVYELKNNEFSHFSEKINKYFWMNWINKDYNAIHHFHLRNLCLLFIFLDFFLFVCFVKKCTQTNFIDLMKNYSLSRGVITSPVLCFSSPSYAGPGAQIEVIFLMTLRYDYVHCGIDSHHLATEHGVHGAVSYRSWRITLKAAQNNTKSRRSTEKDC